ncbi:MAG: hypothetical protein KGJ53_15580, partial [Alphaproteobacteria bacterium]|nr:hypothetical protein [Alphaproteobacteria bacterium]
TLIGTGSRMPSGPAVMSTAQTGRTHDCKLPIRQKSLQKPLASAGPSTHDPKHSKHLTLNTYHHVSDAYLKRYLAAFDFRYSERSSLGVDHAERTTKALAGIVGKRHTYWRTDGTAHA